MKRFLYILLTLSILSCTNQKQQNKYAIVIHGGAGNIPLKSSKINAVAQPSTIQTSSSSASIPTTFLD
jgi:hypothetical protein